MDKATLFIDDYNKLLDVKNELLEACKLNQQVLYECLGIINNNDRAENVIKQAINQTEQAIQKAERG